jgi:hypothetical protein
VGDVGEKEANIRGRVRGVDEGVIGAVVVRVAVAVVLGQPKDVDPHAPCPRDDLRYPRDACVDVIGGCTVRIRQVPAADQKFAIADAEDGLRDGTLGLATRGHGREDEEERAQE